MVVFSLNRSLNVVGKSMELKTYAFDNVEQLGNDFVFFLGKLIELKPVNLGTSGSKQDFAAQSLSKKLISCDMH